MNILFRNRNFSGWRGGLNYYNNLLRALNYDKNLNYLLLQNGNNPAIQLNNRYICDIISLRTVDKYSALWFKRQLLKPFYSSKDLFLATQFWADKIDVTFEVYQELINNFLPGISWIPDFQHVKLPEYFTEDEIIRRNNQFQFIADQADAVIVSSYDARATFTTLYPAHTQKVHVLHFKTPIPGYLKHTDARELLSKYSIDSSYIYLPNQYWKHKNHAVVIEALHRLPEADRPLIISSGPPLDYRNPRHFKTLMSRVRKYNLENTFRYIGEIPYQDVMGLMLYARLVINPSRFEGWSTTVQEAKSMHKQLLLSDIAVHREQAPNALFFNPNSPDELAKMLKESTQLTFVPTDLRKAEQASIQNMYTMAARFQEIAKTAIKKFNSKL